MKQHIARIDQWCQMSSPPLLHKVTISIDIQDFLLLLLGINVGYNNLFQ